MTDEPRLYLRHLRNARPILCNKGGREWFARRGWSWSDFVTNGRRLDDFRALGDGLADRAVAVADEELKNGR